MASSSEFRQKQQILGLNFGANQSFQLELLDQKI